MQINCADRNNIRILRLISRRMCLSSKINVERSRIRLDRNAIRLCGTKNAAIRMTNREKAAYREFTPRFVYIYIYHSVHIIPCISNDVDM